MDPQILHQAPLVAVAAVVGFLVLAFILLYPVWRFLNREEELSRRWTQDEIARWQARQQHLGDGAGKGEVEPPGPEPKRRNA
jgi:membrane protein implicated in regulation of membrane protease activity